MAPQPHSCVVRRRARVCQSKMKSVFQSRARHFVLLVCKRS